MQKALNIAAKVLSILLYPLWIPTYGMALFVWAYIVQNPLLPINYGILCIAGTFMLTALIPMLMILLMWKMKQVSSLYIEDATQRTRPYLCSIICFVFWCFFLSSTMHLPKMWLWTSIGATVALTIVLVVNHWWKISAHMTAMGGLLGGICSIGLWFGTPITPVVIVVLLLSLLLMYARIYLKAHSSLQVVCGYLLGLVCTFLPNLIAIAYA